MLEIPITSEDVLISAMTQGLREEELCRSLSIKPPRAFNNLLQRAKIYINLEDAQKAKKNEVSPPPEISRENKREHIKRPEQFKRKDPSPDRKLPRYES